ncbi:hypothetical protein [Pseudoxanthomonas sp. SE1]|uniref:hypothetical protein n=1 Tax=Pseudoxanthomonas sp. SE1 TaxID=1664560 RepID=UPI00240E9674|nr:hypothetical protein [Pseudoxanthomonas sp. SE1]WFC43166.1 hypothetical protein OY559_06565 [Pseudoxanthomonas sp. SE1]
MLIGYSMPAVNAVSLAAGASWLTTDAGAAMFDGKPARATRIQRTSGSPTINITLASAIVVRVIALLGLNLPEGVTVAAAGASGVTRRLQDGSVACWLVVPAAAATASVSVVITTTQGVIEIGELVVMPAVSVRIDAGWKISLVDPTVVSETVGMQIFADERRPYRRLPVTLSMDTEARVRGGGLANGMDWARLRYALTRAARCVAIPRWETAAGSGVVDAAKLHESAVYGYTDVLGDIEQVRGPWWRWSPAFREIPPAT